jgi:hypothetical protein
MSVNIRTLEDYIEHYSEAFCCEDDRCPSTRQDAEYRFSDFKGEQIKYLLKSDGTWRWSEMCDTGGYWETISDLTGHLKHYFGKLKRTPEGEYVDDGFRCVCYDSQFLTLESIPDGTNPATGKDQWRHVDTDCIVCWFNTHSKTEEEIVLSEFEDELHDEILADINGDE